MSDCLVRVVSGPESEVKIRYGGATMHISFIVKNPKEIYYLLEKFVQEVQFKSKYKVIFNWSGTPDSVKRDPVFMEKITKFLSDEPHSELEGEKYIPPDRAKVIAAIKAHAAKYGHAPNFADRSRGGLRKIANYARTIFPHIDDDIALELF